MPPSLQISVPSTSTEQSPKPHTVYHITLHLPIRLHTIKKRYSDFPALNDALQQETGAVPPVALPAKSWLRSTIKSPELTDERRKGLETYLRAILNADDGRWRQSAAWRNFLELPKGLSSGTDGGRRQSDAQEQRVDPNEWLQLHRDIKSQIHNARLAVRKRETASTAQEQHSAAAEAKGQLVKAATTIARCETALKQYTSTNSSTSSSEWGGTSLGAGEIRRRRDLLTSARSEVEGLETQLRALAVTARPAAPQHGESGLATESDKAGLYANTSTGTALSKGAKPGRVLGGPSAKETERTRELDNGGVLQLQKQMMQEQDEDVLELGKAVSRMKEMGIMINEELVIQDKMLGMVEGDVDRLQGKLEVGKKRIAKIR